MLAAPYLRVFSWDGWHYGIGMPGTFFRSRDGLSGFEEGPNPFPPGQRHAAAALDGSALSVFHSNRGDCPERIFRSTIGLTDHWAQWRPSPPVLVLQPELDYEGVNCPRIPSASGAIDGPAYQLRDPFVFREDGRAYLLYSVAGEQGIAIAEIRDV